MCLLAQRRILRGMNKLTTALLCLVALIALPAAASAAKPVKYAGKTSSGHKVTFKLKGKQISSFETGAPVTCIPIQGGGQNFVGAEPIQLWFRVNRTEEFTAELKPAFYYNEVTMNFRVKSKKLRNGRIKGHLRWQYEFLIPKYPIGTFSIYSCLGEATWSAKPKR
jgi:hypothetical protein